MHQNRLEVSHFSEKYAVRKMMEEDIPTIFELCRGNRLYYEHCGRQNTAEELKNDMTITPPGKGQEDKYYVGFFDRENPGGEKLVAVMDLIDGYPDSDIAYIGFFMMNAVYQGRGQGSSLITELCGYLKKSGFRKVRLAFEKENPQSSHFWRKNGFLDLREVPREKAILIVAERAL